VLGGVDGVRVALEREARWGQGLRGQRGPCQGQRGPRPWLAWRARRDRGERGVGEKKERRANRYFPLMSDNGE
jgi:hypothetical protein